MKITDEMAPARTTASAALIAAATAMADDYQTSENHHPDHVLVPRRAFEAMRDALSAARASAEEPIAWVRGSTVKWLKGTKMDWASVDIGPKKFNQLDTPLYAGPEVTP